MPPVRPSESVSYARLFDDASRGDGAALAGLVETYLPRLRAYVRLHLGEDLRRRESADDVVQSVCRELAEHEHCLQFRDEAGFRGWLFTAALTKVREKGRHHRRAMRDVAREVEAGSSDDGLGPLDLAHAAVCSPSREVVAREALERFEAAFASLSEEHRQVIALARIARLPHAVVAERMGRSVGAVRQLLGRALLALDRLLAAGSGTGEGR